MEEYISQHPQCLKNGCNISLDQIQQILKDRITITIELKKINRWLAVTYLTVGGKLIHEYSMANWSTSCQKLVGWLKQVFYGLFLKIGWCSV